MEINDQELDQQDKRLAQLEQEPKDDAEKKPIASNPRFPKFESIKKISIEKWRTVVAKHFPELVFPTEVGLSIMAQLLIKDITNPFGLVYMDVPSSGKTITLNFFNNIEEIVYYSDNFSPAAFVSQAASVSKDKLSAVDLLPRIKYKTLIVRDLAPLFGARDDDLLKTMGILTRVFDGEGLLLDGGVHGRRGYSGEHLFMFLAASTPIAPRVWKLMGNLGSRLLFLCIHSKEKNEKTLAQQLKKGGIREKEQRMRLATKDFVASCWSRYPEGIEWDKSEDSKKLVMNIGRVARLLARLRGTVNVWEDKTNNGSLNYTVPIIEMPDRLNQLLYNCARGHAAICGRTKLAQEDISMVLRIALDSAPPNRIKTFHALLDKGGAIGTNELMEQIQCSNPTAHREMDTLRILGLVDMEGDDVNPTNVYGYKESGRPEKHMYLKKEFHWLLTKKYYGLRGKKMPELQFKTIE